MSILAICGFEINSIGSTSSEQRGSVSGTGSLSSTTKRSGNFALRCNPTTTSTGFCPVAWTWASPAYTFYTRFYFRYATKPAANSEIIFQSRDGAGAVFEIRIDSGGHLIAWDDYAAAQVGSTGSTALAANTWYRIEVKLSGAGAAIEVTIDGVSEITGTAAGTWAAAPIAQLNFGKVTNLNGNSVDFFYDDVCVSSSGYPGEGSVLMLVPDSDGTYTTWTIGAGSGSKFQLVDENPANGTDYLTSTNVIGDAYTAGFPSAAASGITGYIRAVKTGVAVSRDSASNGTFKSRIRGAGTDSDGSSASSGSTVSYDWRLLETCPGTGLAWTLSGLDGAEAGVVEANATAGRKTRCTVIFLFVEFLPSLNAVVGAFSETGIAASFGIVMPADQGAIAMSGKDANFATNAVESTGQFTLTGNASVLQATHNPLIASAAAFAESGSTVNFNITLPADVGAFAETGNPANVLATHNLSAITASFIESGTVVNFNISLPGATATFDQTGFAASLSISMPGSTGAFVESGVDATFKTDALEDTGQFFVTASNAGLRTDRILPSSIGAFVEQGIATNFAIVMPAGVGVFIIAGAATFNLTVPATVAAFALTGNDATFAASEFEATGQFVLTGISAVVSYARKIKHPTRVKFDSSGARATVFDSDGSRSVISDEEG